MQLLTSTHAALGLSTSLPGKPALIPRSPVLTSSKGAGSGPVLAALSPTGTRRALSSGRRRPAPGVQGRLWVICALLGWDATAAGCTLPHPVAFPSLMRQHMAGETKRRDLGKGTAEKQKGEGTSWGTGGGFHTRQPQWGCSTRGMQGWLHRQESAAAGKRGRDRLPCDWLHAASLAALLLPWAFKRTTATTKITRFNPIFSNEHYPQPLPVAVKGTERSAVSLHAWCAWGERLLFAEMELAAKRQQSH